MEMNRNWPGDNFHRYLIGSGFSVDPNNLKLGLFPIEASCREMR